MEEESISPQKENEVYYMEKGQSKRDSKFKREVLIPYLKDLFSDLCLRCDSAKDIPGERFIDKRTFLDYC